MDEEMKPIWLLVGNIVGERYYGESKEIKKGTKHFSGGTKVYIIDWYPGMCETIIVLGLHKKTKRIISICIKVNLVENLRIKTVYNKNIIKKVQERHGHFEADFTKELATTMLKTIPLWNEDLNSFQNKLSSTNQNEQVFISKWFRIIERLKKIVIKKKP